MQAFQGRVLSTAKLHHASVHLIHQLTCQGPGAHFTEYWIERMIWYLKLYLKDRVKDNGEIMFVNDHLLMMAAAACKCEFPQHCLSLEERRSRVLHMEAPVFDELEGSEGVLLLGRRVASGLPEEEVALVRSLLPTVLQQDAKWYRARGWPAVPPLVLSSMLAAESCAGDGSVAGPITIDKFMQASTPSMDVLACEQDNTHYATENFWALVTYARPNHDSLVCVAKILYFVRISAFSGGLPEFDATDHHDEDASTDLDGQSLDVVDDKAQRVRARPLKMAVCKLWLAEDCAASVIGSHSCRGVPELMRVANMGECRRDKLPPDYVGRDDSQSDRRCFFGHYLVHVAEIPAKLLASAPTQSGAGLGSRSPMQSRFFMTCTKMSGK